MENVLRQALKTSVPWAGSGRKSNNPPRIGKDTSLQPQLVTMDELLNITRGCRALSLSRQYCRGRMGRDNLLPWCCLKWYICASQTANQQGILPLKASDMTNLYNRSLHDCSVSSRVNVAIKTRTPSSWGHLVHSGTNIPYVPIVVKLRTYRQSQMPRIRTI